MKSKHDAAACGSYGARLLTAVPGEAGGCCREYASLGAWLPPAANTRPRAGKPTAQQAVGGEEMQEMQDASKGNVRGRIKAGQREVGRRQQDGKAVGLILWPDWGLALLVSILY